MDLLSIHAYTDRPSVTPAVNAMIEAFWSRVQVELLKPPKPFAPVRPIGFASGLSVTGTAGFSRPSSRYLLQASPSRQVVDDAHGVCAQRGCGRHGAGGDEHRAVYEIEVWDVVGLAPAIDD